MKKLHLRAAVASLVLTAMVATPSLATPESPESGAPEIIEPAAREATDHEGMDPEVPETSDPESTEPETYEITEEARHAGITEEGQGYMGWSQVESAGNSMNSTSGSAPMALPLAPGVEGIDVSGHQGNVNWQRQWDLGKRFAYVKATEGTDFKNPYFSQQYTGSYNQGFIRGAYHFGRPDLNSGRAEAEYFVRNGGGWSADGATLPGVLDIEMSYNGKGTCWGVSVKDMVGWIDDFLTTYQRLTGRAAMIYTNAYWWQTCTGNTSKFANTNPLWIAHWTDILGSLPGMWQHHTVWQYSDKPIDQDRFNGTMVQLQTFARSTRIYSPEIDYFGPDVIRIAGENRYGTSSELSKSAFEPGVETVLIASGEEFPDALSAGPAAGVANAPLLLVEKDSVPPFVKEELARLQPRSITVLGGPVAISEAVAAELAGFTDGDVVRWHGENRYETAGAVAHATHPNGADTVYVASGADFPDGLAAGPAAAREGAPLLLTAAKKLPPATLTSLRELGAKQIVLLGGTTAISKSVETKLSAIARTTRVAGEDRFETAALISKRAFEDGASTAIFTNGTTFPDALSAAALGAQLPGPVLLGRLDSVPPETSAELRRLKPDQLIVMGGENAVSAKALTRIDNIWP